MIRRRPMYSQLRPAGLNIDAVSIPNRKSEPIYPFMALIAKNPTWTDCDLCRAKIQNKGIFNPA